MCLRPTTQIPLNGLCLKTHGGRIEEANNCAGHHTTLPWFQMLLSYFMTRPRLKILHKVLCCDCCCYCCSRSEPGADLDSFTAAVPPQQQRPAAHDTPFRAQCRPMLLLPLLPPHPISADQCCCCPSSLLIQSKHRNSS